MAKIKVGDNVKINYKGMFEDGKIFEDTYEKEPLMFKVGEGKVLKAIEDMVVGMSPGEEKKIILPPELAFGTKRADLQMRIPLDVVEKTKKDIKVGDPVNLEPKEGVTLKGLIISKDDKSVTADFNHPLAGMTVVYKVKIEK
jgi:FKBP-type peptidyl-prolyl cis-trans isomerase 2